MRMRTSWVGWANSCNDKERERAVVKRGKGHVVLHTVQFKQQSIPMSLLNFRMNCV